MADKDLDLHKLVNHKKAINDKAVKHIKRSF